MKLSINVIFYVGSSSNKVREKWYICNQITCQDYVLHFFSTYYLD